MEELMKNNIDTYLFKNEIGYMQEITKQDIINIMVQFATEMCELQKEECFKEFKNEFGSFVEIEKDLFMNNCKNVCTI
jgi:hypothetical protein